MMGRADPSRSFSGRFPVLTSGPSANLFRTRKTGPTQPFITPCRSSQELGLLTMLERMEGHHRITLAADRSYDTEALRVFRRLQFVRRGFRYEQEPEQVFPWNAGSHAASSIMDSTRGGRMGRSIPERLCAGLSAPPRSDSWESAKSSPGRRWMFRRNRQRRTGKNA